MNAAPRTGPGPLITTIIVAALLLLFAALSFTAELGKSATFDEPLHAMGAMVHRDLHDSRIDPGSPALFSWWASLLQPHDALKLDAANPDYQAAPRDSLSEWRFAIGTIYSPDGAAAADRFLNRSRIMFLLLGVILGAIIAWWAYNISGGYAAIVACAFFTFDPNFLAHSALIKSDVPLVLFITVMGYCAWRFGLTGQWRWFSAAVLASALAPNIKLTGIFCGPALLGLLLIRSQMDEPWRIGFEKYPTFLTRIGMIAIASVASIAVMSLIMWASYGFRYSGLADGLPLNSAGFVNVAGEQAASLPIRLDLWLQAHHILPEGWLFGALFQFVFTLSRANYLLGTTTSYGKPIYFPLAILFKTPNATLLAIVCIPVALRLLRSREKATDESAAHKKFSRQWIASCLIFAPAIFFGTAMNSNVNIGLRHVLMIYPAVYIALGVGAAALLRRSTRVGTVLSAVLVLALAAESLSAYPNFLAFFNLPSGGTAGGLGLLGDSNLDWGQDLPALAKWCREHPDRKLYLCYFGTADPAAYGIHYVNLPGGWSFAPRGKLTTEPGVVAMSATHLQGIYLSPELNAFYQQSLNGEKPFAVLNGTIYLFNWPVRK